MASSMVATLMGAQTCLAKIKFSIYSYWNLYFGRHDATIDCKAASTQHLCLMQWFSNFQEMWSPSKFNWRILNISWHLGHAI